jgi:hypothetical protein
MIPKFIFVSLDNYRHSVKLPLSEIPSIEFTTKLSFREFCKYFGFELWNTESNSRLALLIAICI